MNQEQLAKDAAVAASEDCGCAPSPAEQRALWNRGGMTRRTALGVGVLSAVALSAFGISSGVGAAYAATYPSWDDVQKAKQSEAAKSAEITRIEGLIASLTQKVAETEAAEIAASNEFYEAQQAYFEAAAEADDLQAQADEQAAIADESAKKAAQVAAQLYRNGGDDTALQLFFSGSAADADQLLSKLGTMDKLLEYNQTVYDDAVAARDAAQLLTDQAVVAREERDRLQQVAEDKMIAAQEAADAAQAALDEQSANLDTLQSQLAALKDSTAKTVAAYQAGVAERARIEAERKRKEAEEAAKNNNSGGGGGGGSSGGGGGGGNVGSSGWARPHGGRISSSYGPRPVKCSNGKCSSGYHRGLDFANGCGAGIYAASSGVVQYSGYNGGYGYYIKIQHSGGVATGYAHIRKGGLLVRSGQRVSAGQLIAYAGNTGNSLGCHLHFEVYRGGTVNPAPFLRDRGVNV
ncbi:M23 family metallopeptidase [Microbacterium sp. NPDC055903]